MIYTHAHWQVLPIELSHLNGIPFGQQLLQISEVYLLFFKSWYIRTKVIHPGTPFTMTRINFNQITDYKNPLHLDVVDRYLRRMGDKTIPDEAPPSLQSFYPPPWVEGIDLPIPATNGG